LQLQSGAGSAGERVTGTGGERAAAAGDRKDATGAETSAGPLPAGPSSSPDKPQDRPLFVGHAAAGRTLLRGAGACCMRQEKVVSGIAGLVLRWPAPLRRTCCVWAAGENMLGDRFRTDRCRASSPSPELAAPWLLRAGDMKGEKDISPSAA